MLLSVMLQQNIAMGDAPHKMHTAIVLAATAKKMPLQLLCARHGLSMYQCCWNADDYGMRFVGERCHASCYSRATGRAD